MNHTLFCMRDQVLIFYLVLFSNVLLSSDLINNGLPTSHGWQLYVFFGAQCIFWDSSMLSTHSTPELHSLAPGWVIIHPMWALLSILGCHIPPAEGSFPLPKYTWQGLGQDDTDFYTNIQNEFVLHNWIKSALRWLSTLGGKTQTQDLKKKQH